MNLEELTTELATVQQQYDAAAQEKRNAEDTMQRLIGRHGLLMELKTKEETNRATDSNTQDTTGSSSKRSGKQALSGEIVK